MMINKQIVVISHCIKVTKKTSSFRFHGHYMGYKIELIKINNRNNIFGLESRCEYVLLVKLIAIEEKVLVCSLIWQKKLDQFLLFN
jgi:hypothetical protein